MINYEQIKTWLSEKENKQKMAYGICFILVFIVGFGAGKYDRQSQKLYQPKQINYNTKPAPNQTPAAGGAGDKAALNAAVKGTSTPANCLIKGNIGAKGSKIYHMQGGAFYKLTKPELCFSTEAEAQAAGFVKSSR